MTHPIYTQQALSCYNLPRLKRIAASLGVTPTGDKRAAATWINAIITHQSTQIQKLDEQATAQPELNHFIVKQAQSIAPEQLTTAEISFYDHEIYCDNKLIASITHDHNDFVTQRWVVMVNSEEVFRANTYMKCHRFICIHYKDGSLPVQQQDATDTPCTTGNEIMAQIFAECERYGFDIFDDGIYRNDVKLGEVGCTEVNWWFVRVGENQERIPCDSALDAVWWLSMVDVVPTAGTKPAFEELIPKPLEQLTPNELQQLFENADLIAA